MPRTRPHLLMATLLVGAALVACSDDDPGQAGSGGRQEPSEAVGEAEEGIDGVQAIRVGDGTHVEGPIDYELRPPAGGAHDPVWANCGFYDEALPDEHVVHDLEHGAVWLAYSPDLSAEDVTLLHELVRLHPKVIATPYPGLSDDVAVVASAWARQLRVESADDPRIDQFIAEYVDGDQAPEAGVTCGDSSFGEPIP